MNQEAGSRFRSTLRIMLSLSLILAGLCLIAACLSIYHSGDQPFSREAVAAAFVPIRIPVYFCLVMVVLTVLGEAVLPHPAEKKKPLRHTGMLLRNLQERTDISLWDEAHRNTVLSLRKERRLHQRISLGLTVLCSVVFLSYGANPANFHRSQINESMIRAMRWFVPCLLIPFCYGIFSAYRCLNAMNAEILLLKTAPKKAAAAAPAGKGTNKLRLCLLVLGIAVLVYGFVSGGTADVLTKAVNICTECVGLG